MVSLQQIKLKIFRLAEHLSNMLTVLSQRCEQAEPLIGAIISLDRHLEGFRFAQFWSEVDRLREILNPGGSRIAVVMNKHMPALQAATGSNSISVPSL